MCGTKRTIHLDMDGVLVDLEGTYFNISGNKREDFSSKNDFWRDISKYQDLFAIADPMHDAEILVSALKIYDVNIEILTAIPLRSTFPTAEQDKENWIKEYFPYNWKFKIGPHARDKKNHCRPGDILIDDHKPNIDDWIEAGGIGILHTSALSTIEVISTLKFNGEL